MSTEVVAIEQKPSEAEDLSNVGSLEKAIVTPHLWKDEKGVVRITDSRIKVKFLGGALRYRNASVEDLHEAYPHLPVAALHAALSYYLDHKEELDVEMDADSRYAEEMRVKLDNVELKQKLHERWEAMKRAG